MNHKVPIWFDYKESDGQISRKYVMVHNIYIDTPVGYTTPQMVMEVYNLDKEEHEILPIRNIIHEPLPQKELNLGDHVRYIPEFKSQRMLEGIVCFIDGERIYFYSGIMPEAFYGTEMAKRPGKDFLHEEKMYTWELMIQPRNRLEII